MKKLYNIALCYQGITEDKSKVSNYITYIEDFKAQIKYIINLGYRLVFPKEFYNWYKNNNFLKQDICMIRFEGGLKSIMPAIVWLIENKLFFGISIIASREKSGVPEEGYLSWDELNGILGSGFCEIISHSYNLKNFDLAKQGNNIISVPVLELPAYFDNGLNLYLKGDSVPYFDRTIVESAKAFPIIGTDINTNNLIKSSIQFITPKSFDGVLLRLWACLAYPVSTGYNAQIRVSINQEEVYSGDFNAISYPGNIQWPEMEFVTINFNKEFYFEQGKKYNIEFETLNIGNSSFRVYAINNGDNNIILKTSFLNGDNLDGLVPCIIIGDGSGSSWTLEQYSNYVNRDCEQFRGATNKYLKYKKDITQYAYPYGAYLANKDGNSISSVLTDVLSKNGFLGGFTVYPSRIYDNRESEYIIPSIAVYGNRSNDIILNNISAYIGQLFEEIDLKNIIWQGILGYDEEDFVESNKLNIIGVTKIENYKKKYKSQLLFKDIDLEEVRNQDLSVIVNGYDGININCNTNADLNYIVDLSNMFKRYRKKLELTINIKIFDTQMTNFSFINFFNILNNCFLFNFKVINNNKNNFSNSVDSLIKIVNNICTTKEKQKIMISYNTDSIFNQSNNISELSLNEAIIKAIQLGVKIQSDNIDYFYTANNISCFMNTSNGLNKLSNKIKQNGLGGISLY
ncbi:hypothetical protein SAMN02745163_03198 [Clostridium cavendishii DSM 21758]|uniref:Uncharacterized protein n=1 Tax=Clostridium cavendishii DSM 21758 TaxID=1121302 RepID=A0A1M6PM40_9CLOT|nr:hypothetical protein [Clostridium cavendishii]SHK09015.1 hypothetical protein SAMN02745163_03198 [Clostridium cavendishii DSM 21758]